MLPSAPHGWVLCVQSPHSNNAEDRCSVGVAGQGVQGSQSPHLASDWRPEPVASAARRQAALQWSATRWHTPPPWHTLGAQLASLPARRHSLPTHCLRPHGGAAPGCLPSNSLVYTATLPEQLRPLPSRSPPPHARAPDRQQVDAAASKGWPRGGGAAGTTTEVRTCGATQNRRPMAYGPWCSSAARPGLAQRPHQPHKRWYVWRSSASRERHALTHSLST